MKPDDEKVKKRTAVFRAAHNIARMTRLREVKMTEKRQSITEDGQGEEKRNNDEGAKAITRLTRMREVKVTGTRECGRRGRWKTGG